MPSRRPGPRRSTRWIAFRGRVGECASLPPGHGLAEVCAPPDPERLGADRLHLQVSELQLRDLLLDAPSAEARARGLQELQRRRPPIGGHRSRTRTTSWIAPSAAISPASCSDHRACSYRTSPSTRCAPETRGPSRTANLSVALFSQHNRGVWALRGVCFPGALLTQRAKARSSL